MASAGARAYSGVWGLCPQWGPGAKPMVRGPGGRSPPEADNILVLFSLAHNFRVQGADVVVF